MDRLTWRDLVEYIHSENFSGDFDSFVQVYDVKNKQELNCDVIELKTDDNSWISFIGINLEDINNEAE